MRRVWHALETVIFASRWLLVPFYLGLVAALGHSETDLLLGNLMILVIFSGYENFVSEINVAEQSKDRPKWMGDVDFAGLKLKEWTAVLFAMSERISHSHKTPKSH